MKQTLFFILLFFNTYVFAVCEEDLHGVGGTGAFTDSTDSNSSKNINQLNSITSFSDSGGASTNGLCDEEEELGRIVVTASSPGPGWFPHFAPVGSWIYHGSGGGGGGGSSSGGSTIQNNPNNTNPVPNCGVTEGVRHAHAKMDVGYAWNRGQKPRLGRSMTIDYGNHTEKWRFNGLAAPFTLIPGTCRAK